jgi:transposase
MNIKNKEKKKKFIELRSKGHSFQKISEMLDVSERSLYYWAKEFQDEIKFLKGVERENFLASLNLTDLCKFKMIAEEVQKIESAITKKDYSLMNLGNLLKWKFNFLNKMVNFPALDDELMNSYTKSAYFFDSANKEQ